MCDSRISADQRSHSASSVDQGLFAAFEAVAAQQLRRSRGRAGARIQQRDADLAPRERLIQHRQIADHQRDKAQPNARLDDDQHAG